MSISGSAAKERKRVLITRPEHQSAELAQMLEVAGFAVLSVPTVEILPPASYDALDEALRRLSEYQWLVFTSANAVDHFFQRGRSILASGWESALARIRVCVIGLATREAATGHGCVIALMPDEAVGEGLADSFSRLELAGSRVLLPRAAVARDVVPDALRSFGATVDVVDAYRSGVPEASAGRIAALTGEEHSVDWVLFTSSSTVKNFLALGGRELLQRARTASMGPITSATLRKHGFSVAAEAREASSRGMVAAIVEAERTSVP